MSEVYTGEGLVTIKNPGNSKIEIEISGNEKQETREGYNKLENHLQSQTINGVDIVINSDKSITLNGTATAFFQLILLGTDDTPIILSPKTYTMSLKGKKLGINFVGTENGVDVPYLASTVTTESVQKTYQSETTITKILCAISQGTQLNNVKLYPMIYEGTDEKEYEEYGAMPSFDYSSEVKAVGSNINIYNEKTAELNKYISGASGKLGTSSLSKVSDYIELTEDEYVINFTNDSNLRGYSFFDINKKFVSGEDNKKAPYTVQKPTNAKYIRFGAPLNAYDVKLEEGSKATAYSPYEIGSVEIKIQNKNLYNINNVGVKSTNAIVDEEDFISMSYDNSAGTSIIFTNYFTKINKYLKPRTKYYGVLEVKSVSGKGSIHINGQNAREAQTDAWLAFDLQNLSNNSKKLFEFITLKEEEFENCVYMFRSYLMTTAGQSATVSFRISVFEEQPNLDTFVYQKHEEQSFVIPVQQKMFKQDKFDLLNKKEVHNVKNVVLDGTYPVWNVKTSLDGTVIQFGINLGFTAKENAFAVSNYFKEETNYNVANTFLISGSRTTAYLHIPRNSLTEVSTTALQNKLKELYDAGNPVTLWVEAETADELDLTPAQINILNQIENIELYEGINNITATSSIDPNLQVTVKKIVEDYNIYISEKGHLMIPEYNIDYLIDTNESNIPIMPEATESSVRAAGRDGDIVLNTTYEPIPFDIVCYTEDNLTQTEKLNAEKNINKFLNSIKNKTINIAFENNNTFYKVKYSGALVTTNYPKHLKFAIPLKSSDSYGKDLIQKSIVGNNTEESDTIEDVGALFIIRGPALNPIISLNDYSMEYTTSILEGASVEIDTSKSTITNVNNDGIRTNVMKYYNHQFPKIQNGINTLKILSGIDNDKNVIVTWNDLKL